MASDISNIIKSEISNTLESLLSVSSSVEKVVLLESSDLEDQKCVKIDANFEFASSSSDWSYYIPVNSATQLEYLMLGGAVDLKNTIDDETTDAIQEIISTISGSIVTSVNAQGFDDVSGVKFTLGSSSVAKCNEISDGTIYKVMFTLNDDKYDLIMVFDDVISSHVSLLTSEVSAEDQKKAEDDSSEGGLAGGSILNTLLGEESVDNLRLLFEIKMRLSVRLGTKICLLRDVISWDIGEIIELSQMTNEPLDILVNGVVIGKGEAVIVDGKFGVKIKLIGSKKIN